MTDQDVAQLNYEKIRRGRLAVIAVGLVLIAAAIAWHYGLLPGGRPILPENSITEIVPFRLQGIWWFYDDKEMVFADIPEKCDAISPPTSGHEAGDSKQTAHPELIGVLAQNIRDSDSGFRLIFSTKPFEGYQKKLLWLSGDPDGNYYALDNPAIEVWICPEMFKHYSKTPKTLYVQAEPIVKR